MFCCSVCNVMFTGIYPESVFTTPCGHLFHSECILLCLNKLSKCPFCTLHVEKRQLVNLHFQIDSNWKDTAAALKSKVNSNVINLDETLNNSLRIENSKECSNNSSLIIIDDTLTDLMPDLSVLGKKKDNSLQNARFNTKTLLTTSLSGISLNNKVQDLLSIFNDIIPNSKVQMRLLISEKSLIRAAADEGFTNILIVNMQLGHPVGLTFMDLMKNYKISVSFLSLKYHDYKYVNKIKPSKLTIKSDNFLNESEEFIFNFFSTIFCNLSASINNNEINISSCDFCQTMRFVYSSIGLSFSMVIPKHEN